MCLQLIGNSKDVLKSEKQKLRYHRVPVKNFYLTIKCFIIYFFNVFFYNKKQLYFYSAPSNVVMSSRSFMNFCYT